MRERFCPTNHTAKGVLSVLSMVSISVPQLPGIKLDEVLGLCLLDNSGSRTGFSSFEVIVIDMQLALMGLWPWTGAPQRTRSLPPSPLNSIACNLNALHPEPHTKLYNMVSLDGRADLELEKSS